MGRLHRIGLLVPSTNTTVEADFQRLAAHVASFHSQRMRASNGEMTAAMLEAMNDRLSSDASCLCSAEVDVIGYACTSGTFFKGPAWDRQVVENIRAVVGRPAIATMSAVMDALEDLGARRISVATPYPEWTNNRLKAYLEGCGCEVVNIASNAAASAGGHRFINDQEPAEIADFAAGVCHPEADALLCSCTAWRALEAADPLEELTGKPVVTSNQALLLALLRLAGIDGPIANGGSLLRR
ncbi:MAG: aspartate/glutamate racemase family protein [Burkholderiaceae bacterium]|nr:aspartate/glutamate racemase family protein [Burkholderiaceae bacterium]